MVTYVSWGSNGYEFAVVGNSILLGRYKPRFAAKKPKEEEIYASKDLKRAFSLQQASR
jgi:hypothetical protein